ncbi:hypothetical protein D3C81_1201180 [compost metagenome]
MLGRLLTPDIKHGIPGSLSGSGDGVPRGLQSTKILLNLISALTDCGGVGFFCGNSGPLRITSGLKCSNFFVLGCSEKIELLVEFANGVYRVFGNFPEVCYHFVNRLSCRARPLNSSSRHAGVHDRYRISGSRQLLKSISCSADCHAETCSFFGSIR